MRNSIEVFFYELQKSLTCLRGKLQVGDFIFIAINAKRFSNEKIQKELQKP
jgi:hypothetical protein